MRRGPGLVRSHMGCSSSLAIGAADPTPLPGMAGAFRTSAKRTRGRGAEEHSSEREQREVRSAAKPRGDLKLE